MWMTTEVSKNTGGPEKFSELVRQFWNIAVSLYGNIMHYAIL